MVHLSHFLAHKQRYGMLALIAYILINNTINATSNIMEAKRDGELPFELWEPFVWEYSSAIGTLLLIPFILYLLNRVPFNWHAIPRSIGIYWLASIVFSLLHVGIMVGIRKIIYWWQSGNYDFGLIWYELLYEYRKDLLGFAFLIVIIKTFQYIVSQLRGEAHAIHQAEDSVAPQFERLLVKKLGKEFIIKVQDIEWLESAGNYVNLHINKRIYPLRSTLTQLSQRLESKGFCRIHRSYAVRLDAIKSITPVASGDSEITLNSGKQLNLSRRYKDQFKALLKVEL